MGVNEFFINQFLKIETFYSLIILFSSVVVFIKTREAYELSNQPGLKYFRLAFLFYAIGYLFNYTTAFFETYALMFLFVFFVSMAGFYLIYSLIWRQYKTYLIYIFHSISLLVALLSIVGFDIVKIVMFSTQIIIFLIGSILSYRKHSTQKKNTFLKMYFLLMFFFLATWILNLISVFIATEFPAIKLLINIITTFVFVLFLYGVSSQTSRKRLIFIGFFIFLTFIMNNIDISFIKGFRNYPFTLFEMFAPVAGSFLGWFFGGVVVVVTQVTSSILYGEPFTLMNFLMYLPMIFATIYFGTKRHIVGISVSVFCIFTYLLHPESSWYYSILWIIPIIALYLQGKKWGVFYKALGATFLANAVGTVIFLYGHLPRYIPWNELVVITILQRVTFALGITFSYIMINYFAKILLVKTKNTSDIFYVDKELKWQKNGKD